MSTVGLAAIAGVLAGSGGSLLGLGAVYKILGVGILGAGFLAAGVYLASTLTAC